MLKVMDKSEGAEGLFACSKCHGRFAFEELSRSEHLCKVSPIFYYLPEI
jgi:transcription initiation factor IIE alpha subunit